MKRFLLLFLIISLLKITYPIQAEVNSITIRVDGLACPFCAYGLEKEIKKQVYVKDYQVDFKKGIVSVDFKQKKKFSIKQFKQAVKDAGFTYRSMTATVSGKITIDTDAQNKEIVTLSDTENKMTILLIPYENKKVVYQKLINKVNNQKRKEVIVITGKVIEKANNKALLKNNFEFALQVISFKKVTKTKTKKESKTGKKEN